MQNRPVQSINVKLCFAESKKHIGGGAFTFWIRQNVFLRYILIGRVLSFEYCKFGFSKSNQVDFPALNLFFLFFLKYNMISIYVQLSNIAFNLFLYILSMLLFDACIDISANHRQTTILMAKIVGFSYLCRCCRHATKKGNYYSKAETILKLSIHNYGKLFPICKKLYFVNDTGCPKLRNTTLVI